MAQPARLAAGHAEHLVDTGAIVTMAFVLSGGGNLGAVQVGMLRALFEADIHPDVIVATSVGAFNGAWVAGRGTEADIDELASVWRDLRRSDVFPTRLFGGLRGFLGQTDHLVPSSGLRRLLDRQLTFGRLEDALLPIHVVATDITSGRDHLLSDATPSTRSAPARRSPASSRR